MKRYAWILSLFLLAAYIISVGCDEADSSTKECTTWVKVTNKSSQTCYVGRLEVEPNWAGDMVLAGQFRQWLESYELDDNVPCYGMEQERPISIQIYNDVQDKVASLQATAQGEYSYFTWDGSTLAPGQ
jgi:hypothetical protein